MMISDHGVVKMLAPKVQAIDSKKLEITQSSMGTADFESFSSENASN